MAISITAEQFKAAWVQLDAIYVQILNSPTPGAGGAVLSGVGYDTNIDPFTLASSIDAVAALGAPFDALAAILSDPGAVRGDAALAVNLAFMELGNAYVAYLSEDHPAILDIAKLRPNGPGQSFHDNILGNVTDGATNARFPSAYGDGYELTEDVIVNFNSGVRTEAAEAFGTRPIYSGTGTVGDNALLGKTIAFDLAAGLSPAQIDLDGRQGDIVGDRFFVVTTSGVVTGYPDEASARAAAAASADSTFVNTEDALVTTIQTDATGTAGNDWFVAEAGNQTIEGGEGSDTYSVAENNDGGAFVDLSSGIAFGGAETGFDNLQSIENVAGGDGNDVIYGNSGDNVFFASAGEDQVDGRGGNDAFNASSATGDVEIDLTAGTATGAGIDTTLVSVERAIGGQGNDTLVGTVGDNILVGGAGNDTIETLGGNDIVQGGEGTDKLVLDVASGDATIAFINGAWTVTTGEGETAETVILTGVEEVQFSDSTSAWLLGGGSELSINAAIDNAENNDSVYLASGSYTAVGQLSIDASIKIVGSGEGATTIVAGSTAWGLLVTADNVSIEDLTIDAGAVSTYGVKVQPDSSDPADSLTNFSMSDVTVSGANRSEIDLNGVDGANLTNVTVDGQNTGGVGIGISDSTGVVLTNIEALGNNWGSVGLYTKGANWTSGTSDITIVGDYSKLQDSIKIYSDEEQNEGEAGVTNLDLSGILGTEVWKVENNDYRSRADDFTFFFGSEAEAVAHAIELGEASIVTGPASSVGLDTETELTFVVRDGMSIQAALDRAPDGATIYIGAGEYDENLVIKSGVTIIADDGAIVSPANGAAISFGDLDGASVSISGLTLDDGDYGVLIEADDNIGTVDLDGVNILNQSSNAVFVFGNGVASLNMTGGTLSNNGTTEGNTAQVKLYSFSNDASFVDVTVTGGAPSDPIRPDGAFELVGIENVSISDGAPAIGTVVFDNVTVTGEFNNAPVGIYNYSDLSGLSIDGSDAAPGLDLSGTNSGWTSPSGAPLGLNIDGITSDIDASGYEVVGPDGGIAVVLQGEKAGQTPANGQNFTGTAGDDVINGKLGDDVIDGNGGNDFISGGEGTDTARFDAGTGQLKIVDGLWVLEKDGVVVSTLHDVERVEIGSDVYLLVDQLADGGFTSVQAAIDAAAGGETILVAAGENPYVESADFTASPTAEHAQGLPGTNSGNNPLGLLINKSVTLQGVDSAGNLVNAASEDAPVIQSERQSGWGTHFFVTADDVSINGLTLEATPTAWNGSPLSVINKVVEVVGDNFVLTGSTVGAPGEVDVASSVYVNDRSVPVGTGSNWVSQIQTLTIDGNIVEGSVVVANGVGLNGANAPSELILVVNNQFVNNNADPAYRGGIIITGNDDQVAWRNAEVAMPVVEGNTFNDPNQSYLYARSDDLNFMPDRAFVDDFIADNTIETYAFVTNDGDSLQYHDAQTDLGGGNIAHSNGFTLHKDVGSASADAEEGNAVLVSKSADEAGTQTIVTDGLIVKELNADTDLTLELGNGVTSIELADYAEGLGANVNVTGNDENNDITGNSGDNVLNGGGGNDTLYGDEGADTIEGGTGNDVLYGGAGADSLDGGEGDDTLYGELADTSLAGGEGTDLLVFADGTDSADVMAKADDITDVELIRIGDTPGSSTYVVLNGMSIQAAIDGAASGDTIVIGAGTFAEVLSVTKNLTFLGANSGLEGTDVLRGGETVISGSISFGTGSDNSTLDGVRFEDGAATVGRLIYVDADGITITNSVLDGDYPTDGSTRGIITTGNADNLTVTDNMIVELRSGIYFNDGPGAIVTGNTFVGNGNAINIDDPALSDVSGNDFQSSAGAHIAVAVNAANVDLSTFISDTNTFDTADKNVSIYAANSDQEVTGTELVDKFFGDLSASNNAEHTFHGLGGDDLIYGGGGNDTLYGGEGADTMDGGAGNDVLYGGAGADSLDGGEGDDTLYGELADTSLAGGEGTDLLVFADGTDSADVMAKADDITDVELIRIGDTPGSSTYVVLNGMSIQAAIDGAASGDTIVIGAGTFAEVLSVTKDLTFLGANSGLEGTDVLRGGETVISGSISFGTGSDNSTLDGVRFEDGAATVDRLIYVDADGITITNSVLDGDYPTDGNTRGIITTGNADNLTVTDNMIVELRSGIYFNDGPGAIVTGNTFVGNGNAINIDDPALSDVSGNDFQSSAGAHIAVAVNAANVDLSTFISDTNTFDTADKNVSIYAANSDQEVTGTELVDKFFGDLSASNNAEHTFHGLGGDDLIYGGGGNDTLYGGEGADTMDGGAGNDVLDGGAGADTYVGGDGVDTVKLGFNRENVDLSDLVSSGEITSDDGVETVSGVEILEFADSASEGRVLIVGANGFATLQDAIDAATGLDTILLSEGAFGGGVIGASKAGLTIIGIRAEDDAAGRTGSESVIDGNLLVQAEGVRIEGVKFSKDGAGAALTAAATGLVVVNSLFVQDAVAYSGIGIETNIGGAGSGLDVSGSAFHGWATGIYVNGGENIAIGDNLFDGNNVGVSVDAYPGSSNISVSGNAFANSGFEHVGVGLFDAVVDAGSIVGPNTFDASVREVGLYGLNSGGQSISGTEHSDGVFAGSGNDTFIYEIGQGSDTFDGGAGSDTLKIDASSVAGDGTVTIGSSSLSVGSLTVNYNSVERFDITLGAGNHEVDASGSAFDQLTLNMGGGDDIYRAAAGLGHTLNGGDGENDLVDYSGLSNGLNIILNGTVSGSGVSHTLSGFENVRGSTGNDSIVGTTGNNVFLASNGTDFISAGGGVDTFDASSASAAVIAFLNEGSAWGSASWGSNSTSLRHVENLKGSDFDDVLEGNSSANELHGGLGNDRLAGYGGDDFIFGGDGIDTAVFDGGIGSYRIDTATKTIIGSDGTTVLDGVENLEFNGFAFDWDYKVGIGDFDGDGTQDQLIKNPNGWHYVTDGDALVGVGFQSVAAVGDFNGDGKDDVLTYSSSGWLGYIKPGVGGVGLRSLPNHEILAVGDLDGDGKDDILMMNKGNGYLSAQVNGGTTYTGLGGINGREVIGLADLNGDNSQDVIFKSASGWVAAYDLANNSYTNIGFQIGRDLIGVGDFNGDGNDDLLFQTVDNSNGGTIGYTSYLSGGGANVGVGMLGAGAVLAVGNYDGDATDDIFLLNGGDSIRVLPSGLVSQQQAVTDLMLDEVLDFGNGTRVDDDMFIA